MATNKPDKCQKKRLHCDLIADLLDVIHVDWDGYNQLLLKLEGRGLTPVEKCKSKKNVSKLFEYLERRGLIKVGEYGILLEVLENLNEPARDLIMEYKSKIDGVSNNKDNVGNRQSATDDPEPCCSKVQKLEKITKGTRTLTSRVRTKGTRTITSGVRGKAKATSTIKSRVRSKAEERTLVMMDKQLESDTFVPTLAVIKGKDLLERNGVLIYSGLPGEGKTENAFYIMNQLRKEHPETVFIKMDSLSEWVDVDLKVESVVFFEDCFGRTNANMSVLNDNNKWKEIESCVDKKKVRLILTVRQHIFKMYRTKLENDGTKLFMKENVIDLSTNNFCLTDKNKSDILQKHCKSKNIEICLFNENYKDEEQIDARTVDDIVHSNCPIGFPYTCYLFTCHPKYTKQGAKFFEKPLQVLKEKICELASSESKYIEKVQYCLLSYMVMKGGEIDLKNLDHEIFNQIIQSLGIKSPSDRKKKEAIEHLNDMYIVGENMLFSFKHQTILESVALCFKDDNISMLLQCCSENFITEFVRPVNYKDIEGEEVIKLNLHDYGYIVQRFTKLLQETDFDGPLVPEKFITWYHWWAEHPMMDDEQFVDSFIAVIKSEETFKNVIQACINLALFNVASEHGKHHLLDRLYYEIKADISNVDTGDCLVSASDNGETNTVLWLLDHKFGLNKVKIAMRTAPVDTKFAMLNHQNVTLDKLKRVLFDVKFVVGAQYDNAILDIMSNRLPNINQKYVLKLLSKCLISDYDKTCGAMITRIRDVASQQVIHKCLRVACVEGSIKIVELILSKHSDTLTKELMKEGFTLACSCGHINILDCLLNLNPSLAKYDGNIAYLHVAAYFGKFEVLVKLINLGLVVNVKSVMSYAMLGYRSVGNTEYFEQQTAIKFKSLSMLFEMEDGKWDPGTVSDYDQIMNYLLRIDGISLSDLDTLIDGNTLGNTLALHCVKNNCKQTIEVLKECYDKTIYSKTSQKLTCLHIAALFGRADIFEMLLNVGLSITDKDIWGRNVLHYAMIGFKFVEMRNFNEDENFFYYIRSDTCFVSDSDDSIEIDVNFNDGPWMSLFITNNSNIESDNDSLGATDINYFKMGDIVGGERSNSRSTGERDNGRTDAIIDKRDFKSDNNKNVERENTAKSNNDKSDFTKDRGDRVFEECLNSSNESVTLDKFWDIPNDILFQTFDDCFCIGNVSEFSKILINLIRHKDIDITDLDIVVDSYGCTLAHYCVVYNCPSVIKTLCEVHPSLLSVQNEYTDVCKPIDYAACFGRDKIFEMLYSIGDYDKDTLYRFLQEGRQFQGTEIDSESSFIEYSFLSDAICFLPFCHKAIDFGYSANYDLIHKAIQ